MKYSTRKKLYKLLEDTWSIIEKPFYSIRVISVKINDSFKTKTNEKKAYKEFRKVIQKKIFYRKELYLTDGYVNNDITVVEGIDISDLFDSRYSSYLNAYIYTVLYKLKLYTKEEFINKWINNLEDICKKDGINFKEISKDELFRECDRSEDKNYSYSKIKRVFKVWE
jgi:hypothetical protein